MSPAKPRRSYVRLRNLCKIAANGTSHCSDHSPRRGDQVAERHRLVAAAHMRCSPPASRHVLRAGQIRRHDDRDWQMQSGADVKAKIGREAAEQFAAPAPQPGELGPSGTALICACDDEKWALYKDGSPTMFSGGLLQALREGDAAREPMLGISDIYTLTRDHIIRMHRAVPLSCCASIESAVPRLFCVLAQSSGTRSRVHSCDTGGVLRAACGAGCHRNRARPRADCLGLFKGLPVGTTAMLA